MDIPRPTPGIPLALAAALALALAPPTGLAAQVGDVSFVDRPGWQPADGVDPEITAQVTFDETSDEWVYDYTVANGPSAEQDILEVWFRYEAPDVLSGLTATPPAGWRILPVVGDAAIPGSIFLARLPDEAPNDVWPPSPHQIPPGGSTDGFRIRSPFPPGEARTYVRGYAPIPFLDEFGGDDEFLVPHDTTDAQRGWSVGPTDFRGVLTTGRGQRSDVDSLLVFMNLDHRITVHDPVPVALKLDDGAAVSTLQIELNRVDVTDQFFPGGPSGADLVGYFPIDASPMQAGRNVLLTVIEGEVVGNNGRAQTHTDRDRIQFTVEP